MALDKSKLANDFFEAFSNNTELTDSAKAELETKCKAIAEAIDTFVKSVEIQVDVAEGIPVATAGSPAAQTGVTTGPGIGLSSSVY